MIATIVEENLIENVWFQECRMSRYIRIPRAPRGQTPVPAPHERRQERRRGLDPFAARSHVAGAASRDRRAGPGWRSAPSRSAIGLSRSPRDPSRLVPPGWLYRYSIRSPIAAALLMGTTKPSLPPVIRSGAPVFVVAMTGTPHAMASLMTYPNPSSIDGKTSTDAWE